MAQEINLGGTIYISSKSAAEKTGYTQDYIGQLARGGLIAAQRVSGLWYVVEESLRQYKEKADTFKPIPPRPIQGADLDSSISFDGKDYISAQRAASITGYHQDYVGQLARSGKILSRQIGNRWYVDREGLIEHKKHNDALLAAVQAESVGLLKETSSHVIEKADELHFTYEAQVLEETLVQPEPAESIPPMQEEIVPEAVVSEIAAEGSESIEEEVRDIPIRIIDPTPTVEEATILVEEELPRTISQQQRSSRKDGVIARIAFAAGVGIVVIGIVTFLVLPQTKPVGSPSVAATSVAVPDLAAVRSVLETVFGSEIHFKRTVR